MAHNDNAAPGETAHISLEALTALRESAEAHLDMAQNALFDDAVSDEDALSHLDAALACLNIMIADQDVDGDAAASIKFA